MPKFRRSHSCAISSPRRVSLSLCAMLCAAALASFASTQASAQADYPNRSIRMLYGFAPGTDVVARLLADKLTEAFGKPVIVENITGAGGNIAADRTAKAAPDGYTIGVLSNGNTAIALSLYKKLSYDPLKELAPVSLVYGYPNVLVVNNDLPVTSVAELVALAKKSPGKLTYGSSGPGSTLHLSGEVFNHMAGLDVQHIPFRGSSLVTNDLLGGQITMSFIPPTTSLSVIQEKKLRPLAVTSMTRAPFLPDVKTMDEQGFKGFDVTAWFGMFVPAGTPQAIIEKLNRETVRIMAMPDIRAKAEAIGTETLYSSPDELAAKLARETPYWAKVIKDAGMAQID